MSMEVIFLGVGSSGGTPVIGCDCATCTGGHPRNQRTRASVHIKVNGIGLQIDTGPDLRLQALRENIRRVDAVLFTHQHADHLNGIDDLRAFCYWQQQVIPVYGPAFTMADIESRFGYALLPPNGHWDKPTLSVNPLHGPLTIAGVEVIPIPVLHGKWPIYAYRIGDFAWLTDVSDIPASSLPLLRGLKVLAIDCLRQKPHPTHLSMGEALQWIERIGAESSYLIHMTHELDYLDSVATLPDNVFMAWDGLRLQLHA